MPTILSDVVFRDELRDYMRVNTVEKTAFFQSGILVSNGDMSQLLASPSNTFTIPWWVDLDASIESNYSNDVYTDIAVPLAVTSAEMQARAAYLNEGWAAMNLVKNITNQDPLEFVASRLTSYWQRVAQRRTIATVVGIYNDNVAGNGGDMVVDAGGPITAAAVIRARATMGDYTPQIVTPNGTKALSSIVMHSAVYAEMSILNLIDFTPIADQVPEFGRYQNMLVVIDDGMPVIGTGADAKYLSIIFGPGAIGYAEEQDENDIAYDREEARGNGGGAETLWTRRNFVVHPLGYSFLSATITGTPGTTRPVSANWSDLALATNWQRKWARKQVPLAFITSTLGS
ncbi:coat protein [Pseudomonas fulva]|uniref:coat protein n=1 Tax=Pseudomonas fulva TaxID=47880 RepID=UPI0018AB12FE|nr:coat protein [Pseudomonas fulva]MBF8676212.1 coat protein [Pseudomonas fulva]MBF8698600.1 coat protein [Pseudomonas fulva]